MGEEKLLSSVSRLLMSLVGEMKIKKWGSAGGDKDKFADLVAQVEEKSHLRQKSLGRFCGDAQIVGEFVLHLMGGCMVNTYSDLSARLI